MVLRKLTGLFACALLVGMATTAMAGVPVLAHCEAGTYYHTSPTHPQVPGDGLTGQVSLYCLPSGGGRDFEHAFATGAVQANATVWLLLRDGPYVDPTNTGGIENYPAEDMWIAPTHKNLAEPGLVACSSTFGADLNTDEEGYTEWRQPLFAGGYTDPFFPAGTGTDPDVCIVYVNGDALLSYPLALNFNSGDISGDGSTNLTDAGFMTDAIGTSPPLYYGNFNFDSAVNISDAGFMTAALGASCP
jgi:hypothetical protein